MNDTASDFSGIGRPIHKALRIPPERIRLWGLRLNSSSVNLLDPYGHSEQGELEQSEDGTRLNYKCTHRYESRRPQGQRESDQYPPEQSGSLPPANSTLIIYPEDPISSQCSEVWGQHDAAPAVDAALLNSRFRYQPLCSVASLPEGEDLRFVRFFLHCPQCYAVAGIQPPDTDPPHTSRDVEFQQSVENVPGQMHPASTPSDLTNVMDPINMGQSAMLLNQFLPLEPEAPFYLYLDEQTGGGIAMPADTAYKYNDGL